MTRRSLAAAIAVSAALASGVAVAADPAVSVEAEPRVIGPGAGTFVTGVVPGGAAGDEVLIEQNPCGLGWSLLPPVRGSLEAGGRYNVPLQGQTAPVANSLVRASWRGRRSSTVRITVEPWVFLRPVRGKLRVEVVGLLAPQLVTRKRYAVVEARRSGGLWKPLARVKLRLKNTPYGEMPVGSVDVKPSRYAFVRAVLPASQAAPCYRSTRTDPIRP
jgi:hypothetical protein